MAKLEMDAVNMMRGITLHATVKRGTELRWRMWLGTRLMFLGAWVMNCKIEITGVVD